MVCLMIVGHFGEVELAGATLVYSWFGVTAGAVTNGELVEDSITKVGSPFDSGSFHSSCRLGFLMSSLICVRYFGLNENVYGRCGAMLDKTQIYVSITCRMIHGLRIKDGKASYVSRFVKTSRFKQEEYFNGSKFMKIGDLKGLFGLLMVNMQMLRAKLKIFDVSYGHGTANTALVYHHQKLLALSEGDKPYAIKILEDGDLQTLGMLDYDKRLGHNFTAHPKVDPFTGEMFTLGYSHTAPYVAYREMVKNKTLIFSFDSTKKARFGVLPRYAKDEKQYQMV
ncbi:Dixin [Lathyrus oleraceus]|uniref:carotenoid 9,10-dioxygenase n=1 Tax=Pisum sativum TaxID=3888 RepID=A0A9D4ZY68_PEA|nr:Dixin [Pisum sativum]